MMIDSMLDIQNYGALFGDITVSYEKYLNSIIVSNGNISSKLMKFVRN